MRILLSAFGFSPFRGSESAVGWNLAKELARWHEVTVITGDVRNCGYEREYPDYVEQHGEVANLRVVYLKPTWPIRLIERLHDIPGLWCLYYLAYWLWQKNAFMIAKKLHREKPFDIAHHLTMIGYREPGYMWKLGIPFYWGPVGGSVNEPLGFWKIYSGAARIKAVVRFVVNGFQKRLLLRPRKAAKTAKKIWAVSSADVKTIAKIWGCACEQMVESGVTPMPESKVCAWDGCGTFRIVWSGTHTYGKAFPILICALEQLKEINVPIMVDILGRGGETEKWKAMARAHGVDRFLNWIGYVPHCEALKLMSEAHCLVFTSVKEGTPHVVMEALSLGLPVICHDACGMGIVVNETCGIKIPMVNPITSIVGFAAAIKKVVENPSIVERLSKGAIARARELTWAAKAVEISRGYEEARRGQTHKQETLV